MFGRNVNCVSFYKPGEGRSYLEVDRYLLDPSDPEGKKQSDTKVLEIKVYKDFFRIKFSTGEVVEYRSFPFYSSKF